MRFTFGRAALATLAGFAALLGASHSAAAQAQASAAQNPQFTVRLGGFFTSSSTISHSVGSSFLCGGLDYALKTDPGMTRTIASLDYIDRSSGGTNFRMYPLTIGQMIMGSTSRSVTPYYGIGLGAYFINENISGRSEDTASFGGYGAVGVEFNRFLVIDARYHLVTAQHGIDPDGLELTAGFRF